MTLKPLSANLLLTIEGGLIGRKQQTAEPNEEHENEKKLTKNPGGDLSYIIGYVDDISGDVSGISGDLSGIRGNVSDIRGDVDDCEITPADRAAGIAVVDLTQ